jgi:hypothetical protein
MLRPLYPREIPGTHCIVGWVGPRSEKVYTDYDTEDYKSREDLDISGLTAEGNFGIVDTCIRERTMQILQFKNVQCRYCTLRTYI